MTGVNFSVMLSSCSLFLVIGTMTTCIGASFGGSTSPLSSECVIMSAPISLVETPHDVAQTYSGLLSLLRYVTSNAFAKFCPRKWLVPLCRALPSCIIASIVYVSRAPAKRSVSLFTPCTTGTAMYFSAKSAYTCSIFCASASASSFVACAVWPSCQRNSDVRRNGRVRISHRMTLHHWLHISGRSRQECIQFL